jgi:hypothetical protein
MMRSIDDREYVGHSEKNENECRSRKTEESVVPLTIETTIIATLLESVQIALPGASSGMSLPRIVSEFVPNAMMLLMGRGSPSPTSSNSGTTPAHSQQSSGIAMLHLAWMPQLTKYLASAESTMPIPSIRSSVMALESGPSVAAGGVLDFCCGPFYPYCYFFASSQTTGASLLKMKLPVLPQDIIAETDTPGASMELMIKSISINATAGKGVSSIPKGVSSSLSLTNTKFKRPAIPAHWRTTQFLEMTEDDLEILLAIVQEWRTSLLRPISKLISNELSPRLMLFADLVKTQQQWASELVDRQVPSLLEQVKRSHTQLEHTGTVMESIQKGIFAPSLSSASSEQRPSNGQHLITGQFRSIIGQLGDLRRRVSHLLSQQRDRASRTPSPPTNMEDILQSQKNVLDHIQEQLRNLRVVQ